jgi:uncharacterized protein YciI
VIHDLAGKLEELDAGGGWSWCSAICANSASAAAEPVVWGPMPDYYLVTLARGPAWDHSRRRREQLGWEEHAAFMDALTDQGIVVLGGPMGEGDGDDSLLVVDVESEAAIRGRLAQDPWANDMLTIESVRPWSVWLRAS